jgi:hypothetical protein
LHQLRCPPLFVAVADHLPPPDALLLRHRCRHCHTAANFINAPPLPSSLHRLFCLIRRAAVACHAAAAFCRRAAASFLVMPVLPLSTRYLSLNHRTAAPFIVAPPFLPLSSRRLCLPCRAAAAFIVTPPVLSSSSRRLFCLHRRVAGSAFVVAPPLPSLQTLPSLLRRRCLHCRAAAAFIIAIFNLSYHIAFNILMTILLFTVVLYFCITILVCFHTLCSHSTQGIYWTIIMFQLELYRVGIFWSVSVGISWYLPYRYQRKTWSVFSVSKHWREPRKKLAGAPFFPRRGDLGPLFVHFPFF